MKRKINYYILISILVASAVLRLGWLSRGDTVNDEVFYAFRAVGLVDFDEAEVQTTPFEWFDPNIPSWTHFSFHDAPPLVFFVQHIFMKVFGESNFGFRFSAALAGIAAVYLIFLIGKKLFSANAGLMAAALIATTLNGVYISRIGILEPYLIFFMLLAVYLFLKSFDSDKYFLWTGIALGFGLLTKYNAVILIPVFLAYILLFKRSYLKNKKLWLGVLLALIVFSPVIFYNLELYHAKGHFDFQISHFLGQYPKEWQVAPGREIGNLAERLKSFVPRLINSNSWLFLSLFTLSVFSFFVSLLKDFKPTLVKNSFLVIVLIFLSAFIIDVIGPSYRFLTILTPFMALSAAIFLSGFCGKIKNQKIFVYVILALIFGFEILYSVNNQIIYYPKGPEPWLSSKVRYENYNWGYNELQDYLENELKGKLPALTFDTRYKFLNDLRDSALEKGRKEKLELYPALIVYNANFDRGARLWVLDRFLIYHAWPVISEATYFDYLEANGPDFYEKAGFKNYYYISGTNIVPLVRSQSLMVGEPISIHNKRGDEAFKIYKF